MDNTPHSPTDIESLDSSLRQECEVWQRVMGYHRPTKFWNIGKKAEHEERMNFIAPGDHYYLPAQQQQAT